MSTYGQQPYQSQPYRQPQQQPQPYGQQHAPPPQPYGAPPQQQPYQPPAPPPYQPQRQKQKKKVNRVALIVLSSIAGVLVLCVGAGILGAFLGDDDKAGGGGATVPAYQVVNQTDAGDITIEVDALLTKKQMEAIVTDLRDKQTKETGYFVSINCSTGGTSKSDNRLGNGRFGIGNLGKARTGLEEGVIDVQVNEGRSCPAN